MILPVVTDAVKQFGEEEALAQIAVENPNQLEVIEIILPMSQDPSVCQLIMVIVGLYPGPYAAMAPLLALPG
jgi:hypothetical protein